MEMAGSDSGCMRPAALTTGMRLSGGHHRQATATQQWFDKHPGVQQHVHACLGKVCWQQDPQRDPMATDEAERRLEYVPAGSSRREGGRWPAEACRQTRQSHWSTVLCRQDVTCEVSSVTCASRSQAIWS